MMKALLLTVVVLLGCSAPRANLINGGITETIRKGIAEGTGTFAHTEWDEILVTHAREGGRTFDYAGLKREPNKLDAYLERLAEVDLSSLARSELLALFINAYNAYTVRTVLNRVAEDGRYLIKSIRDIPSVFDRSEHRIGGYTLSLNNIEHNILRPIFRDPRIHFALNCASFSCPPLPTNAFTGDRVEKQLDEVTRIVLRSPDYVRVESGELLVSRIMDWYGQDFVDSTYTGSERDLPSFLRKYTRSDISDWIQSAPVSIRVEFMDYDWRLNRSQGM